MKSGFVALLLLALQLGDLRRSGVPVSAEASASAPSKPTLIPLSRFPAQTRPRARAFFRTPAYEDAALIAVTGKRRSKVAIARDMPRLWRRAAPSQRVFIAFARRDLATARVLQRELERKGYHCFVYLPGRGNPQWADAVELGRYFRESTTRFVIDSRNARAANGVRVEALAQGRKSCCKRCYYLNGVLAGCQPVTCGPQCANARGS